MPFTHIDCFSGPGGFCTGLHAAGFETKVAIEYIQSAYALGTEEKAITENKPFALTGDSFPKIIVRHDIRKRWYDDSGILNIGVIDFLLDDSLV